ncbi:uncharacterized protein KD926_002154 [Aspergillus affinis]|uniref:uncharacterized protein n=1 Tax=Aspergillus affinis TaxID=1070780 RepID=UPI0022FE9C10|nr:uncharacterized protein KD926_002154 [Aspergillus affinis]KAI9036245.1 hypothetical protein KD926_002154 [Aspergillus affinis]
MPSETPSIFVCGPQTTILPPQEYFAHLRQNIHHASTLQTIDTAIAELPEIWKTLVKEYPPLREIPGAGILRDMKGWITGDTDTVGNLKPLLSNMHLGPLTVVLQVLEYLNYLAREGVDHSQVVGDVKHGGFQGLCTGFLTASALSCSRDTVAIGKHVAVALRLALCIGAMVDLENQCGVLPAGMISLTVRWTSGSDRRRVMAILARYKEAYLSVNMDTHSISITTPEVDLPSIFHDLSRIGVQIISIGLKGRFHHPQHSAAVSISHKVFATSPDLFHFPKDSHALVPLRSNDSGALVSPGEPLHETAVRCSLLEMADWHATMSTAVATVRCFVPNDPPLVLGLGLVDCVPLSILDDQRSAVVYRRALETSSHVQEQVQAQEGSHTDVYAENAYLEQIIEQRGLLRPGGTAIGQAQGQYSDQTQSQSEGHTPRNNNNSAESGSFSFRTYQSTQQSTPPDDQGLQRLFYAATASHPLVGPLGRQIQYGQTYESRRDRLPDEQITRRAVSAFFQCAATLFYVTTESKSSQLLDKVYHSNDATAQDVCEVAACAAIGSHYKIDEICDEARAAFFYLASASLNEAFEASHIQGVRISILLLSALNLVKADMDATLQSATSHVTGDDEYRRTLQTLIFLEGCAVFEACIVLLLGICQRYLADSSNTFPDLPAHVHTCLTVLRFCSRGDIAAHRLMDMLEPILQLWNCLGPTSQVQQEGQMWIDYILDDGSADLFTVVRMTYQLLDLMPQTQSNVWV